MFLRRWGPPDLAEPPSALYRKSRLAKSVPTARPLTNRPRIHASGHAASLDTEIPLQEPNADARSQTHDAPSTLRHSRAIACSRPRTNPALYSLPIGLLHSVRQERRGTAQPGSRTEYRHR